MKKKDAKIATKIAEIASRDSTIGSLNANIVQLQQTMSMHKVDKNFLLTMKKKFWE